MYADKNAYYKSTYGWFEILLVKQETASNTLTLWLQGSPASSHIIFQHARRAARALHTSLPHEMCSKRFNNKLMNLIFNMVTAFTLYPKHCNGKKKLSTKNTQRHAYLYYVILLKL
jgi:hypothetical protein